MCAWYFRKGRSVEPVAPKLTRRAALASGAAALFWRRRGGAAGPTDSGIESSAYLATCDGRVARVRAVDGETTGSWSLPELGWASPVRDGCVLDRLVFRPPDSLLAVIPTDPAVDEEGARHFRVVEWGLKDWQLRGGFYIADPLASAPNLLVPGPGSEVLLAYEKTEGAAMTQLNIRKVALLGLPTQGDGPWFSRDAVWASGKIVDRTQVLQKKGGRWELTKLPPPTFKGMPWNWVGPKIVEAPTGELEGVIYSVAREGHTDLMLWAGKPLALTRIEGVFGAKQLTPTLRGNGLVSAGTKEPAQLWDLLYGKLLMKAPEDWQRPQRVVCLRDDGTCILEAGGRIFLFGMERSREVFFGGPADGFLSGVFAG